MNKNYIDNILEEFDSIFITNEKFDNLISMGDSPDVYEPSGEMYPKKIKSYLKQKLQEVEKKSYEKGFIDGSELTGRIAEETRDKKVDEIINEIEKQDIAKDKVGSFYDGYIRFKDQILYYLKNK